ncbi:unnamed protein product [Schistocephalus solidus]|uniref:Reverse transcriptase domain-containing protein n=1 Tax=Schistocephalus solidus TaxID=70667 RepID=A0A183TCG1_SCHSO|nr:unnamed protein product [Schistocephalus solidus]
MAEHLRSVLSYSSAIYYAAVDRLPQVNTNNDLDLPPFLPETIRAVQQISNGPAPGKPMWLPPASYKCQEMRNPLNTAFIDLLKAFDTVNCDELWKVMQNSAVHTHGASAS